MKPLACGMMGGLAAVPLGAPHLRPLVTVDLAPYRNGEGLTKAEALDLHARLVTAAGGDVEAVKREIAPGFGLAHLFPPLEPTPPAGWATLENVR